jgi:hypothetical protein
MTELHEALKTCKESAPGPDGITYDVYKKLWDIFGKYIFSSWEFSEKIGNLATSQRDSVITLLEKKGKDKSLIENLRPISLSNCDIKICTKALALRTNVVLNSILTTTQTGYIPGKQITDNCRLIEEIIELSNSENQEAYLITLDAQKAFDSVDHEYLHKILKCYGFPVEYIRWVKIIYTNLRSNVMINGYLSEIIEIERSVKQGDALSCALFVLAIDPLLRMIDRDERITPININQDNTAEPINIKTATFADDITAITKDKEGINHIIDNYNRFSNLSGIRLNIPKTEIMSLGKNKNKIENFKINSGNKEIVIVNQKSVKICGITFSTSKEISYEENIVKRIDKLTRILNVWRQRNLTLKGKILIAKTFAISQVVYAMQSTTLKKEDLLKIEREIYKFIWNIKNSSTKVAGKIKRDILKGKPEMGGLNAPDIQNLNSAIKFKYLLRAQTSQHPLAKYTRAILNKYNFNINEITTIKGSKISDFLQETLQIHNKIHNMAINDINQLLQDQTRNNDIRINKLYKTYIGNIKINNLRFTNKNQVSIVRKMQRNNIYNYKELVTEFKTKAKPHLWFEVLQIINSFPRPWRMLIEGNTNAGNDNESILIPIKENIFKHINYDNN